MDVFVCVCVCMEPLISLRMGYITLRLCCALQLNDTHSVNYYIYI